MATRQPPTLHYDLIGVESALEGHRAGQARIVPIIIRSCDWKKSPLARLAVLPDTEKPLTEWRDRDAAFSNIVAGIRRIVEDLTLLSASTSRADLRRIILAELADSHEDVRSGAAQTLAALKDPDTVPAIISRLDIEPEPITRYWLAYALGRIGGELALNALQRAKSREVDPFVQQGINEGLQSISIVDNTLLHEEYHYDGNSQ